MAALDDEIGIGADHQEIAPAHGLEPRPVILDGLVLVVVEAGADHVIGLVDGAEAHVEPIVDRHVAGRADVMHDLPDALLDGEPGQVAGGDDGVIGRARHAETVELRSHRSAGARRVGDEDHLPALGAEAGQRVACRLIGFDAVMQHAPDIAEDEIVAFGERLQALDVNGAGQSGHGFSLF